MRLPAPERAITGVWDEVLGRFVDQPEPVSRWIARAILHVRDTTPRPDRDLTDLKLVIGYEIQTELLKEMMSFGMGRLDKIYSDRIYGAQVEEDYKLAIPFELRWTSLEEAVVARLKQQM